MSSPSPAYDAESDQLPSEDENLLYVPAEFLDGEDDDDMDFEPASESIGESFGESDLEDTTEYYGGFLRGFERD